MELNLQTEDFRAVTEMEKNIRQYKSEVQLSSSIVMFGYRCSCDGGDVDDNGGATECYCDMQEVGSAMQSIASYKTFTSVIKVK